MCFSTSASFVAGTGLGIVGIITLRKINNPSQLLFAALPLLFALQQFTEGLLWLSLSNGNFAEWERLSASGFIFFAQVVWPVMVPLSILLLEKESFRKKILMGLTAMGIVVSMYLAYCLMAYPVKASIASGHIHYALNFPIIYVWLSGVLYFLPTVVSPMIAGNRTISLLGISTLLSYIFTKVFFSNYMISVWCFFAAVISGLVLYIVVTMNRPSDAKTDYVTAPGMM